MLRGNLSLSFREQIEPIEPWHSHPKQLGLFQKRSSTDPQNYNFQLVCHFTQTFLTLSPVILLQQNPHKGNVSY